METKIKANYKVGDVFLESDGWGKMIVSPAMGNDEVYTYVYINTTTLAISHNYYTSITSIVLEGKYLFNLCDLFRSTKEAVNEDTNT
jgi:hypothetical protein